MAEKTFIPVRGTRGNVRNMLMEYFEARRDLTTVWDYHERRQEHRCMIYKGKADPDNKVGAVLVYATGETGVKERPHEEPVYATIKGKRVLAGVQQDVLPKHSKVYMTSSMPDHMKLHDEILTELLELFGGKIHRPVAGKRAQELLDKTK